MNERTAQNECYSCKHRCDIPRDAHSSCNHPDPDMRGSKHGIKNGWFFYPFNFDPIWKIKLCNNYENKKAEEIK